MDDQLQSLNLSEADFKLIIDGLDSLPEKGAIGELMGDMMLGMLSKDDENGLEKIKAEREKRRRNEESKKDALKEDIKILQGKLLMLKRYLKEKGALNQTYDIINNVR